MIKAFRILLRAMVSLAKNWNASAANPTQKVRTGIRSFWCSSGKIATRGSKKGMRFAPSKGAANRPTATPKERR